MKRIQVETFWDSSFDRLQKDVNKYLRELHDDCMEVVDIKITPLSYDDYNVLHATIIYSEEV